MVHIELSPRLAATVEQLLDSGGYTSVDDVLEQALTLLQEREQWERLQASLIEAEVETERGELTAWTPALRLKLRAEAKELAKQGARPNPDVCP